MFSKTNIKEKITNIYKVDLTIIIFTTFLWEGIHFREQRNLRIKSITL